MAIDDNETTEVPKAIKGVDKETVHRICSGQVNASLLSFLHMYSNLYSRFSIRSCVGPSLFWDEGDPFCATSFMALPTKVFNP